jgi:hypothetical protein
MIGASVWHEIKFCRSPALLFCNAGFNCLMAMRKNKIVAEVRKRFFVFIASTWHDG